MCCSDQAGRGPPEHCMPPRRTRAGTVCTPTLVATCPTVLWRPTLSSHLLAEGPHRPSPAPPHLGGHQLCVQALELLLHRLARHRPAGLGRRALHRLPLALPHARTHQGRGCERGRRASQLAQAPSPRHGERAWAQAPHLEGCGFSERPLLRRRELLDLVELLRRWLGRGDRTRGGGWRGARERQTAGHTRGRTSSLCASMASSWCTCPASSCSCRSISLMPCCCCCCWCCCAADAASLALSCAAVCSLRISWTVCTAAALFVLHARVHQRCLHD